MNVLLKEKILRRVDMIKMDEVDFSNIDDYIRQERFINRVKTIHWPQEKYLILKRFVKDHGFIFDGKKFMGLEHRELR